MEKEKIHFGGIDGLRTISCMAIIAMHIRSNTNYHLSSFFYDEVVSSWTELVYLFLMISGFALSVGYYDKVKSNKFDLNRFYSSRYKKTLPFFSLLILIEVLYNFNYTSLIEGITELTLSFGLLPNNSLDVIGVSWTLGVIFVFYFMYPFFVFLLYNKARAWLSFFISLFVNYFCQIYFFSGKFVIPDFTYRHTFIFCGPFFLVGGLVYLYLNDIIKWAKKSQFFILILSILFSFLYYLVPDVFFGINVSIIKIIFVSVSWLIFSLSGKSRILDNKFMSYFSKISLEMYLAQMVIFRLIEKTIGLYLFGDGIFSYLFVLLLTIIGLVIFIEGYKAVLKQINKCILYIRGDNFD
ncbi:TPA: acyltransferase family protein [Streptococcus suis]